MNRAPYLGMLYKVITENMKKSMKIRRAMKKLG